MVHKRPAEAAVRLAAVRLVCTRSARVFGRRSSRRPCYTRRRPRCPRDRSRCRPSAFPGRDAGKCRWRRPRRAAAAPPALVRKAIAAAASPAPSGELLRVLFSRQPGVPSAHSTPVPTVMPPPHLVPVAGEVFLRRNHPTHTQPARPDVVHPPGSPRPNAPQRTFPPIPQLRYAQRWGRCSCRSI